MTVEKGSGNVFADLGIPDPEEHLEKAKIAVRIADLADEDDLVTLGADPEEASRIYRGRLRDIPLDRLSFFLEKLGDTDDKGNHG